MRRREARGRRFPSKVPKIRKNGEEGSTTDIIRTLAEHRREILERKNKEEEQEQ